MVHVTQDNVAVVDVDLLIHECLQASEGKNSFAYIVSPFIADFEISPTWSMFVSNLIEVSDIDSYVDIIGLLRHYGGRVFVVTRSPKDLAETSISANFVTRHSRTLFQLLRLGCTIRTNHSLHAKATVTSGGVLSGSFNLTRSGRIINLEAGFYFPNTEGMQKDEYQQKLNWVKEIFDKSLPLSKV
jgi:hypothetical protein